METNTLRIIDTESDMKECGNERKNRRLTYFRPMIIGSLFLLIVGVMPTGSAEEPWKFQTTEDKIMMNNVHWLGHSSIKLTGKKIIYIDPYKIKGGEMADIILITHDHYDHMSLEDIRKIRSEKTVIVAPSTPSTKGLGKNVRSVVPGMTLKIDNVEIQTVPMYNIGKRYHPKDKNYVGYVIKFDGVTYYHAGDIDAIPELKDIKADVVFLPVGGTYTMNAAEAAKAASEMKPKFAVPIHWGSVVGSLADAEQFKKLATCNVVILKQE